MGIATTTTVNKFIITMIANGQEVRFAGHKNALQNVMQFARAHQLAITSRIYPLETPVETGTYTSVFVFLKELERLATVTL